jgi:hypothetical protein
MNQKNRVDRTILMDRPIHAIDQNHWTLYTIQLQSSAAAGRHRWAAGITSMGTWLITVDGTWNVPASIVRLRRT